MSIYHINLFHSYLINFILLDFVQDKDMSEAMQLLEAVFKTITAAISQHPANRLFFEEQIGLSWLSYHLLIEKDELFTFTVFMIFIFLNYRICNLDLSHHNDGCAGHSLCSSSHRLPLRNGFRHHLSYFFLLFQFVFLRFLEPSCSPFLGIPIREGPDT